MDTRKFNKYSLHFPTPKSDYIAYVFLFNNTKMVGTLHFMRKAVPPNAGINPNGNVIEVFYPGEMLGPLLDVLRLETGLKVSFKPANKTGSIEQ